MTATVQAQSAQGGTATVLDRLAAHVAERPFKPFLALYRGDVFEVWTYADLAARAALWARRLAPLRDGAGVQVAFLVLGHGVDAYAAFLGAMQAGLAPSLLPPPTVRQRPQSYVESHRAVLERTRPRAIVTQAAFATTVRAFAGDAAPVLVAEEADAADGPAAPLAARSPGEVALLQHSSGTTGLKKGVPLSFAAVDRHVAMLAQATGLNADDVVASWLPLYHDMGLVTGFLAPLTLGASVVALDPFAWVAEPAIFFRAVERHRATAAWTPNFAFAHAARTRAPDARFDLSSLRMLVDCSEPCRPETVERFLDAFAGDGIDAARIACCYGLAEVVFAATCTRPGAAPRALELDAAALERGRVAAASPRGRARRLLSCGGPLPGVELAVDAPAGCVGEICVRSETACDGYFGVPGPDPSLTPAGWRRSGDVGFLDGGELFVCGRIKETLIVNGRNLYAGDLEAAVGAVAGVKPGRAAVVALDDAEAGSEAVGVLLEALDPGLDLAAEAALKRAVRAALREAFDVAVREVAVGPPGWLAKSTAGKMSRAENLARLRALLPPPDAPEEAADDDDPGVVRLPMRTLVETVARALADCFGCDAAAVDAATAPDDVAGWDSLGHTVLVLRLERATGLRLGEGAADARSVGELAERLAAAAALQRRAA